VRPDLKDYLVKSNEEGMIPVWDEIMVDMETPISIYSKIAADREHSYLLESVTGGEHVARYSFMGIEPLASFRAKGSIIKIKEGDREIKRFGDPVKYLKEFVVSRRVQVDAELPYFFGGAVGYLSYDWIRYLEKIPNETVDDLGLPDGMFTIYRINLIYDHVKNTLKLVVLSQPGKNPEASYCRAGAAIELLKEKISRKTAVHSDFNISKKAGNFSYLSTMNRDEYVQAVQKILEYIRAGDVFQTVLSTRLETKISASPLEVYRCLRTVNPSPYMFFLNFLDFQLVGASPEMLVKVENGQVYNRPIAGTRPRGENGDEDLKLASEMMKDPKERAEHVMLVDLARNDVGRIAEFGTVHVPEFMAVEKYSHVMHLVSLVKGQLAGGRDAIDALMACFPAGTVSGAPKIRSMEIIEKLEPTRRGPYAGAVGYLGLNGNIDTCITIRTVLLMEDRAFVQAGAGIVADSDPLREYEESINKGRALIAALHLAERRAIS